MHVVSGISPRSLGEARCRRAYLARLDSSQISAPHRLILSRRQANDAVSGSIQIRFSWDISAKSLLILKKQALERVIAQRTEIMSLLYPVDSTDMKAKIEAAESSIQKAQAVEKQDHNDGYALECTQNAKAVHEKPGRQAASADFDAIRSASTSDVTTATEDFRFSDILNEAKRGTLAVTVVAAKGLSPHKHNPLAAQLQATPLVLPFNPLSWFGRLRRFCSHRHCSLHRCRIHTWKLWFLRMTSARKTRTRQPTGEFGNIVLGKRRFFETSARHPSRNVSSGAPHGGRI